MTDRIDQKRRSANMAAIKAKHTGPEVSVRKALHAKGFRFRLHRSDLPGRPDVVLPKYRVALFVHGCFWHRHQGCADASIPKSNTEFWLTKLNGNVSRDKRNREELIALGWRVYVVWECELKNKKMKWLSDFQKFVTKDDLSCI